MAILSQVEIGLDEDICLVCGVPLSGTQMVGYLVQEERLTFCGNDCLKEFLGDPERYRGKEENS